VAIADAVEESLRDKGYRADHVEGYPRQEWVLMDYGTWWSTCSRLGPGSSTTSSACGARPGVGVQGVNEAPSLLAASAAMRDLLASAERVASARARCCSRERTGRARIGWLPGFTLAPSGLGPFVPVHCPSLPGELLESELFGHEKGAFTDARNAKPGRLELAQGGTLYLDQVQELDLHLQAKLLRVVEEKRFERVGGHRTLELDARIVASANVDLRRAVAEQRFREDLYHRLAVLPLVVPPLRERREDLLPLALVFLAEARERARPGPGASRPRPGPGCAATPGRGM